MYHFCTIASPDFLPFAEVLLHSLKQNAQVTLHVLVIETTNRQSKDQLHFYQLNDIADIDAAAATIEKYKNEPDNLRWALKPFLLLYLLQKNSSVIYLDNDIYFYNSFSFLFDELEQASLLLTPHWASFQPQPYPEHFMINFQLGLFNAGFVGATQKGIKTLQWWAQCCLFHMSTDYTKGFFVDQRYLDATLILDKAVSIVQHPGCNLGSWNLHQNIRSVFNNEVVINSTFPVIFVHYNNETIKHILNGNDLLLRPFLEVYKRTFAALGYDLSTLKNEHEWFVPGMLLEWKRKSKVRTRIKNLLFHLHQKL